MTHQSPSRRRLNRPGFTLMEIMIVLGIIAILVGAVAFKASGILGNAKKGQVDSDFKTIESALASYQIAAGQLPSDEQGLDALVERPTTDPQPRRWSAVLDSKSLADPWGTPYAYKRVGSVDPQEPELISAGEDLIFGNDDDQSNQKDPQ